MTKPSISSAAQRRGPVRNRPAPMALEQRLMFDAAGVIDVTRAAFAVADAAAHDTAPAEAPATDATTAQTAALPEPAAPEAPAVAERREVAFVDTSVAGYQALVAGIRPGVEVVLVDSQGSALAQMAAWAQSHSGYDAIHVLSHGAEGQLQLGRDSLTTANVGNAALLAELQQLGRALTADGDLLLYGCGVADGETGQAFLRQLAEATGADVAGSTDATGAAALGGNWTLEQRTGATVDALQVASFEGLLNNPTLAVTSLSASTANGSHGVGDTIVVQVNFSEAVHVTGTPQLTLETGSTDRVIDYSGGSGTSTLSFNYTVQAGDSSADLDAISSAALALNGGTIRDGAGNDAPLTLPAPGAAGSLGANKAIVVDGVGPSITNIAVAGSPAVDATALTYTVLFSEAVTGVDVSDFQLTATGSAGGTIASLSGSGSSYSLVVNNVVGTGTLRLDLKASGTGITDAATNALAGGYTAGDALSVDHRSLFDAKEQAFSFGGTPTRIAGAGTTVGTSYLYSNVITIDGQQIDAIVTLSSLSNATVDSFDNTGNPYADPNYFQPNVNVGSVGGYALFNFAFIKAGSYNASTAPTGTAVVLRNVLVNTYDLDGAGASASGRQFTEFSGIGGYTLSSTTQLATPSDLGGGVTRFVTTVGGNISSAPGTVAGDNIRARVSFDAVSQTTIKVGDMGATGVAYFGLDFSPGPTFTNARTVDVAIAGGPVTTSESGTTGSFTVALTAAPSANVTVTLTGLNAGEGTLSTSTLTFTTANWSTPQTVTVTGVDDALVDGNISYTLTATTASADTTFNGRTAMVTVTNQDNDFANAPPVVGNLAGDAVTFTEGGSPVLLDAGGNATVTDAESINFDTGTLTVAIVSNGNTGEDVLAVANQGTGAGQISVSGSTISYGGTAIGTFTGGSGGSSLVVSFNCSATPAAAQALVRALTYANSDTSDPSTAQRTVRITLTDGDGGTSTAADVAVTVVAVNDAPVNSVPGAQDLVQNGNLVFSSANGNAISVADVDAGSGTIRVTLAATQGTLTLSGTSNLSFWAGSGSGDASMTIEGTQAAINAALAGMTYTPNAGYNGTAQVSITTSDLGLSGSGGTLTDTDTINLTVLRATPVVTSVSSSSLDGLYGIGDTITLTVTFDQAVVVNTSGGTPTLQLETGNVDRSATYLSGSGTSTLSFQYVVQPGDLSGDLDFTTTSALSLGGATIQGLGGSTAVLMLPSVGGVASIAGQNALVVDGVRPTASIAVADSNLAVGETSLVTITFSEPVTGLSNADLTVANGTLSAVSSADGGITWTATFTPNAAVEDSSNLVTLDNTGVQDAAGNTGTGSTDSSNLAIDTLRPTIALSSSSTVLAAGQTAVISFTLSEASNSFGADDIAVSGGALSGFSGAGTSYSATFTPDAGSTTTATLQVDSNRFSDAAGNANTDGNDADNRLSLAVDTAAPAVNGSQQFTYAENRSPGALLATVATDDAAGVNAFEITGGNNAGYFAIDASGRITLTSAGAAALSPANDHEIVPNAFTLQVRARDVAGNWSASQAVLLQLSNLNDNTPVAGADSASTQEDMAVTVDVLANDSDADGDALVIRQASMAPEQGTVAIVDGRLVFSPAPDFNGTATITYVASDGANDSAPATLTVSVAPVDDAVVLPPVTQTVAEDSTVSGNLLAGASSGGSALQVAGFQIAGDNTAYTAGQTATIPGVGTLAIGPDGSYTFTPAPNWNGSAPVVTFSTSSGASSTLNLQVMPVADAVQVSSPVVNEASPYAVFSVSGVAGEALSLQLAGDSATDGGTDFGAPGAANLEVSVDGGATWQPYADGLVMPAGGSLLARTPVIDDGLRDNNETFSLSVTPAGGVATTGTATIKDDGTGSIFGANGQVDANAQRSDDRVVSVSSPVVNEASPWAVFTVTGSAGQALSLQLAGASASDGGTDFGAPGAANLEVSVDGGATWQPVADGLVMPAGGSLLARTPVIDDGLRDNNETFSLSVTPAGGVATTGTATIKDDGTGAIFGPNGQVDANAQRSDDRVVSVSSPVVNEASPWAVFTVTGSAGQPLSLQLAGDSASADGTDFGAPGAANLEVSVDGGATWQPVADGLVMPAGGSLLARTPVIDDGLRDNNETFSLSVTPAGGVATTGTATIKDDGTGSIFGANGQVDASAQRSDDRVVSVSSPDINEASPFAVFTITGEAGQRLALQLDSASATLGDDIATALEYFDGNSWQPVTGMVTMAGDTLLVRVAVSNDGQYEGAEQFVLRATPEDGQAVAGTATLRDDGAGQVFNDQGQVVAGPGDDDRPRPAVPPQTTAPAAPVTPPRVVDPPAASAGDWVWLPPVIDPGSPVSGGEVHTLVVADRTPDQFFSLNTNVRFALPIGLFKATQPTEQLLLSVEQADGRPLPPWLSFNPSTRTFEGMPPPGLRGEMRIKITARDTVGNQADALFRLHIGEELDPGKQAAPERPAQPDQLADPRQPARKTDRPGRAGLQQQLKDLAPPRRAVTDQPRDLPREQPRMQPAPKA